MKNFPTFTPNNTSEGLKWTINPNLPSSFEFVTETGSDEGCIRMKQGQTAAVMPAKTFIISCTLTVGGTAISRATQVSIQVDQAAT